MVLSLKLPKWVDQSTPPTNQVKFPPKSNKHGCLSVLRRFPVAQYADESSRSRWSFNRAQSQNEILKKQIMCWDMYMIQAMFAGMATTQERDSYLSICSVQFFLVNNTMFFLVKNTMFSGNVDSPLSFSFGNVLKYMT